MRDTFGEIREQIHEIRNLVGPVHLKLSDLEHQLLTSKALFEERAQSVESKIFGALIKVDKHDVQIADILERLKRLEQHRP